MRGFFLTYDYGSPFKGSLKNLGRLLLIDSAQILISASLHLCCYPGSQTCMIIFGICSGTLNVLPLRLDNKENQSLAQCSITLKNNQQNLC